ncbi:YlxM family DNA-binding protein [Spiroplasma corruscae]|nr:sigma factor-like helix-turn-helix DNA-binding protein [Spiroplasma corruscae]
MSNNDLEKTMLISEYFDYYKNLLTDKQKQYFELYFFEDYSFQEIADELKISKSAVHDSLTKTVSFLKKTEEKLNFVYKHNKIKHLIESFKNKDISVDNLLNLIEKEI